MIWRIVLVVVSRMDQREELLGRDDVVEACLADPLPAGGLAGIKRRILDAEGAEAHALGGRRSLAQAGARVTADEHEISHAQIREDKPQV